MILHMAPSDITTIKVSKGLRDRISAQAAERHRTVQNFIEHVLDDYERHLRISRSPALAAADDTTLNEWRAESDAWAGIDADLDSAP